PTGLGREIFGGQSGLVFRREVVSRRRCGGRGAGESGALPGPAGGVPKGGRGLGEVLLGVDAEEAGDVGCLSMGARDVLRAAGTSQEEGRTRRSLNNLPNKQ